MDDSGSAASWAAATSTRQRRAATSATRPTTRSPISGA
jgi:hypothetical protein